MPYTASLADDDVFLRRMLLQMVQERSLGTLLQTITASLAGTEHVALARIWLIRPGDICPSCPMAGSCSHRETCLHLVASAGQSLHGEADWSDLHGQFRRFPLGERKIGVIARDNKGLTVSDIEEDRSWIAKPEWARAEGIRGFTGKPLSIDDEVVGVLGIFTRSTICQSMCEVAELFAKHAAVSIENARAFDEIERLKRALAAENELLREELGTRRSGAIVGDSPAIRSVVERIALVAPTPANVLITGESGTGKELAAREIHRQSDRKSGPLVRVNCAAIPETLFESEFFGHAKGAFTGALQDREGRFAAADGGTLFLDEIGEIPLALQGKLLRVLQEGTYERVGEERQRLTDVRLVAATNRDLLADVENGTFRADLYYRLNVVPIHMPPLRDRLDDLPVLASFLLDQIAARFDCAAPGLTRGDARKLAAYDWPGNIRELVNVLERALVAGRRGRLALEVPTGKAAPVTTPTRSVQTDDYLTEAQMLEQERKNLESVLRVAKGRVAGAGGAADLLGVKATTLYSRLKRFGIDKVP